jgi:hypothetical protein
MSSLICLGLVSCLFPSGFPTKILYEFHISLIQVTCLDHLILLDYVTIVMFCEEYKLWSSTLCYFFPVFYLFSCHRSKYSSKYPVRTCFQLRFLHLSVRDPVPRLKINHETKLYPTNMFSIFIKNRMLIEVCATSGFYFE